MLVIVMSLQAHPENLFDDITMMEIMENLECINIGVPVKFPELYQSMSGAVDHGWMLRFFPSGFV